MKNEKFRRCKIPARIKSCLGVLSHTGESRYPVTFPEIGQRRWIPGQARNDGKGSSYATLGFTLLEVMISVAIVGGLLVTLLYTLNYHLGIAERHRSVTISAELAKGKMYDMEKTPVVGKGTFPDPYSDYSFETGIRASLMPNMSEIWVVVKSGKESITLSELIKKTK